METSGLNVPPHGGSNVVALGGSRLLADLENGVLDLTVQTLERRGNRVSAAHREALGDTSTVMTLLARGSLEGRVVIDLPTGSGKTTLLVCWTKVMVDLGLDWSIAICAARVEELEDIYQELLSGDLPVPEEALGFWHSKEGARIRPTYPKGQEHLYATKRILLLTHARVQSGPEIAILLRYQGRPRDLVVYDESLTTTEQWEVSHADVVGDIKGLRARLGYNGPDAALLEDLSDLLDRHVLDQGKGEAPLAFRLSFPDERSYPAVLKAVRRYAGCNSALARFLRNPDADVRPLVIKNDVGGSTLIRSYVKVPDELNRMVVLDASFPVRSLLRLANERLAPDVPWQLRLILPREGRPWFNTQFKRYDHVTMNLMPTRRSGRCFVIDDMECCSTIANEIAAVVAGIPREEGVLIWTFKSNPGEPHFTGVLREALKNAGVNLGATVEVDGHPRPRIVIDTFGRETATNAYRYCTNVLFTGCLEPAPQTLAAQYVAETRDLTASVSSEDLDLMVRGEVYHRIYQGMSRAACREIWIDEEGRSQAKPTKVWLFTRHHQIQEELGAVLPGARWTVWLPRFMSHDGLGRTGIAAMRIREILDSHDGDQITIRALKAKDPPLFKPLSSSTFQRARDAAITGSGWTMSGSSLIRAMTRAGVSEAESVEVEPMKIAA